MNKFRLNTVNCEHIQVKRISQLRNDGRVEQRQRARTRLDLNQIKDRRINKWKTLVHNRRSKQRLKGERRKTKPSWDQPTKFPLIWRMPNNGKKKGKVDTNYWSRATGTSNNLTYFLASFKRKRREENKPKESRLLHNFTKEEQVKHCLLWFTTLFFVTLWFEQWLLERMEM